MRDPEQSRPRRTESEERIIRLMRRHFRHRYGREPTEEELLALWDEEEDFETGMLLDEG